MRYEIGDKVKIKTWEKMIKEYPCTYYELVDAYGIRPPNDKFDFSNLMEKKINDRCCNRIDIIQKIDEEMKWYYLKNSKTIITHSVIECKINDNIDSIENRFEILDL